MYTKEDRAEHAANIARLDAESRIFKHPRLWTMEDMIFLPIIVMVVGIAGLLTVFFLWGITALTLWCFTMLYIQISPLVLGAILCISIGAAVFGAKVTK